MTYRMELPFIKYETSPMIKILSIGFSFKYLAIKSKKVYQIVQSSSMIPGTRLNSSTLWVTTVISSEIP